MTNKEIAAQFTLLSKLMEVHAENAFKVRSYSIAAFRITQVQRELQNMSSEEIFSLEGIGAAIGNKISQLLETGKMDLLERMLTATPPGIVELLSIKGIGAKKVGIIWKEMGIESAGELLYACNENRLMNYKGFGKKSQQNIAEAIEFFMRQQGSFLYAQVEAFAFELLDRLKEYFRTEKIALTGSFARQAEVVTSLEYVLPFPEDAIREKLKGTALLQWGNTEKDILHYHVENGPKVLFHSCGEDEFAWKQFVTTGSEEFLLQFIKRFPKIPKKEMQEVTDVFIKADIPFIPAYLREDPAIIEKANENIVSNIIQPGDIKGIIHSHSDWSDGAHSIEKMAKQCIKMGLEYLVISDHSKSAFYAGGLSEDRIRAQHLLINELNAKLKPFHIFKSIECDILNDGSLDYNDGILSAFDLVITSVHSNLKMTEEKAMQRLLKAIEHPRTTILGHMTGRLLLSRPGYPVNFKKVIDACAANGVVIEINANPRRLDMPWQWISYALSKGVMISIDPDAHSLEEFPLTRYGVLVAQKGMLTPDKNLSSFSLAQFRDFLATRQ